MHLRHAAAEVLAAAVLEVFPHASLIQGGAFPKGFYYDFAFPFAFNEQFLPLIEEKMRAIVKEKRVVKLSEMVPVSAAALMHHRSQPLRAQRIAEENATLLQIVQIGEFADVWEGDAFPEMEELSAFKLVEAYSVEADVTRILGVLASDKQALKTFLKEHPSIRPLSAEVLGEELRLFSPCDEAAGWFWHPKGEWLRQHLISLWREESVRQSFEFVSTPSDSNLWDLYVKFSCGRPVRWTECKGGEEHEETSLIVCLKEELLEECISSLQFITKISKILRFECRIVLSSGERVREYSRILEEALRHCQIEYTKEKRSQRALEDPVIEWYVQDSMGRECLLSYLKLDCIHADQLRLKHPAIERSVFCSLEHTIWLLLENSRGDLPLRLAPEQVRILGVGKQTGAFAADLKCKLQALQFRVGQDSGEEPLSERVYKAAQEKVPYVVIVGEKELAAGTLSVRSQLTKRDEKMSVTAFIERLRDEFENQ